MPLYLHVITRQAQSHSPARADSGFLLKSPRRKSGNRGVTQSIRSLPCPRLLYLCVIRSQEKRYFPAIHPPRILRQCPQDLRALGENQTTVGRETVLPSADAPNKTTRNCSKLSVIRSSIAITSGPSRKRPASHWRCDQSSSSACRFMARKTKTHSAHSWLKGKAAAPFVFRRKRA